MDPAAKTPNTEFVNPVLNQPAEVTHVNYNAQPAGDGQLQTVVVVQAPPPGVGEVSADPLALELQKTTNCAWATLGSCFWPISIVALVYTCKAKDALKAGQREEAERYDSTATKLSWSSCLIGSVIWIIGISVYIYFQTTYSKF